MKAIFRVTLAGVFPQESNTPKRRATVTVETDRATEKKALVELASTAAPPFVGKLKAAKIVLVNKAGEPLSLAPKLGAEYQRAARARTLEWLLADRMSNYGYDWKDYRRLIVQRARARAAVRRISCYGHVVDALDWGSAGDRLTVDDRRPEYCCGQSWNEEITNLLRTLARVRGGWVA